MKTLRERLGEVPQIGRVEWIGLRPGHEVPMSVVQNVEALTDRGLQGDRVTLIQAEHLPVIASLTGRALVEPERVRRNLVVRGVNLKSLERMRFYIGEVLLEGTGPCEPCAKMDIALGEGGFHAMRGHGGITAKVLCGGLVAVGDRVIIAPMDVGPAPR
jgi:MOSC domain-containing protein YiiM